jgi:diacylglycerol kinase (ATP)
MKVAPDAALDDGWFDVVTLGDISFANVLLRGTDIYRGKHLTHPWVTVNRARMIALTVRAS